MPSMLASIFSVLFSLSIVFQLSQIVDGIVLGFLGVFTLLFLIANENLKVKHVRNLLNKNNKSLVPFALTFVISMTLSCIGVYFWTNTTQEVNNTIAIDSSVKSTEIKTEYLNKINVLTSEEFESTKQYKTISNSLNWWKTRKAANITERKEIRSKILNFQNKIDAERKNFNLNKEEKIRNVKSIMFANMDELKTDKEVKISSVDRNNAITIIFIIMVFITEIGIIVLNVDMAKLTRLSDEFVESPLAQNYMVGRKILTSLYLSMDTEDKMVNINQAKYSPALHKLEWDDTKKWTETKKLYNLLINIGILDTGDMRGRVLWNNVLLSEKDAYKKFDNYYNVLMSI
jgi:hypothetical protein